MAVNPTYKHLQASVRLGPFSVGQWMQVVVAVVLALLFGVYVSPLPIGPTIFVSILLAGLPVAVSYAAMAQEWSVLDAFRAQWHWLVATRRYVPGPSTAVVGYVVQLPDERPDPEAIASDRERSVDRSELWDY